jgi:hypothetical protein
MSMRRHAQQIDATMRRDRRIVEIDEMTARAERLIAASADQPLVRHLREYVETLTSERKLLTGRNAS